MKTIIRMMVVWMAMSLTAFAQSKDISPEEMQKLKQMGEYMRSIYGNGPAPEGAKMFMAIIEGSQMGAGEGWFGPAESRYDFGWLMQNFSKSPNKASISREDFKGSETWFAILDRNRDGQIQPFDLDWSDSNPYVEMSYMLNRVFRRMDTKGDGALSREDWNAFFDEATKGGTSLTAEDLTGTLLAGYNAGFIAGDAPTPEILLKGLFSGEIGSMYEGPKVGQQAPLFELRKVQGDGTIQLKSLLGDKPIVLVFGNFTCGPFRAFYPAVDRLYEKYKDRAHFVMVYVREAHPEDGWKMQANSRVGVAVQQPVTFEERANVAGQFCQKLSPKIPVVVDEVNDPMGHAYSGMPARLYVISPEGNVVFKNGRGPFGFKPPELEQALVMSLLEEEAKAVKEKKPDSADVSSHPKDDEIWNILPQPVKGRDLPLPNWAKVMAVQLPKTTAALLQLDYAQRTKSPLDPKLRAKIRYVIAQANRCEYSKRTALLDLQNAGATEEEVREFLAGETSSESERNALTFAHLHTTDAPHIEDSLFEKLVASYGEKKTAAMVLLGAYGNFQDRLLLGLGIQNEGERPLPPLAFEFDASTFQSQPVLPSNQPVRALVQGGADVVQDDGDWGGVSYQELQNRMKLQKDRQQRLRTPTWEEIVPTLPPQFAARPTRIVWNLVCMGYVPELAVPWSQATRTMWVEAPQDRVFEECLFWVQTRAVQCNYCMGHCEMLLEVAGLSSAEVTDRLRALASSDWSMFSEKEQRTFAYARKLTVKPWELTQADFKTLQQDLGEKEAMAVFFWLCRGLYMTRVSDGFQLKLESDNVFADYAPQKSK